MLRDSGNEKRSGVTYIITNTKKNMFALAVDKTQKELHLVILKLICKTLSTEI